MFVELGEYSQNMLSEAFWTPNIASSQFDEYPELGSSKRTNYVGLGSTITPNYVREANVRQIRIKNGLVFVARFQ